MSSLAKIRGRTLLMWVLSSVLLSGCETLGYQYDRAQQGVADRLQRFDGEETPVVRSSADVAPYHDKEMVALDDAPQTRTRRSESLSEGQVVQVLPQPKLITATGYAPISAQPGATQGQRVLNAMRASKLRAYQELAAIVHGQYLFGTTRVKDMVVSSDQFDSAVGGIVRGARVVKSYPLQEDIYATILDRKSVV